MGQQIIFNSDNLRNILDGIQTDNSDLGGTAQKIQQDTSAVVGNDWTGQDSEAFANKINELTNQITTSIVPNIESGITSTRQALTMLEERERNAVSTASSLPGGN